MDVKCPTPEEVKAALDNPEFRWVQISRVWKGKVDEANDEVFEGGFTLEWGVKHLGWGTIEFTQKTVNGKAVHIECRSEKMGADFVRKALEHFAKTVKIAD